MEPRWRWKRRSLWPSKIGGDVSPLMMRSGYQARRDDKGNRAAAGCAASGRAEVGVAASEALARFLKRIVPPVFDDLCRPARQPGERHAEPPPGGARRLRQDRRMDLEVVGRRAGRAARNRQTRRDEDDRRDGEGTEEGDPGKPGRHG